MIQTDVRSSWLTSATQIAGRAWFLLLLTAVAVFFSEKAYWYPQGFAIWELILFYAVPVYASVWMIEVFKVNSFPTLVLVAGFYAFLVEGVLTPVIFEAGLFDPVMPAYFIGWHGLLVIVFGWYVIRQWLINGQTIALMIGSIAFGIFWGAWSVTYWLPEHVIDWPNAIGPLGSTSLVWTPTEFGLYGLIVTLLLVGGHLILGRGAWLNSFSVSRGEKWVLFGALLFLYATLSFIGAPFGLLTMGLLLTAVFIPLNKHRKRGHTDSILTQLEKPIQINRLPILLLMPVVATAVYATAFQSNLDQETVLLLLELMTFFNMATGGMVFIWAMVKTIRG